MAAVTICSDFGAPQNIANYNMSLVNAGKLNAVPLFNLLNVLEAKVINDAGENTDVISGENTDVISGEVTIALPQSREHMCACGRIRIILIYGKTNTIL